MIKLQIIGYVGQDATKEVVNNKSVINFSVAHSEEYDDAQGVKVKKTTWVRCSLWSKSESAGVAPYIKKGTQVYAEGVPSAGAYTNKAGEVEASLNLKVFRLELLASKKGDNQANGNEQEPVIVEGEKGDDLPF